MKNKVIFKTLILIVSPFLLAATLVGCGTSLESEEQSDNNEINKVAEQDEDTTEQTSEQGKFVGKNPIVTITMDNGEEIIIELYPDVAPNTVNNFISLINDQFYNGLIFHRVIPDFMIQGGDPNGTGMGDPGYAIKGEFSSNNIENNLKHDRGVLAMARSADPDSAGSQFFIVVNEAEHLDGDYAAFGEVIEGMDVVDKIVSVDTNPSDKPLDDQQMKTVVVDTKGQEFPEPEKE